MARDRIGKARSQHHKLVLLVAFGRLACAPHCVIETPELASGARVHVAHSRNDGMSLVIEIQAIGDQLVEVDFRGPFEPALAAATISPVATIAAVGAIPSIAPGP